MRRWLRKLWRFLVRMDVASVLLLVTLLLAALGALFPQRPAGPGVTPHQLQAWDASVVQRYGSLTGILFAIGAFQAFRSPLFLAPVIALAIVTLLCTADRWHAIWQRALRKRIEGADSTFDNAPHHALVQGPLPQDTANRVQRLLEERGYHVRFAQHGEAVHMRADRNKLAPLASLATHFGVLLLLVAVGASALGWREQITIDVGGSTRISHLSSLELRCEGFFIERYPDGTPAGYWAAMTTESPQGIGSGVLGVNHPLDLGGASLYLQSYFMSDGGTRIGLLVVRDPSYGPALAAGFLILFGVTTTFTFPYTSIQVRTDGDRLIRVAGHAQRRASDFHSQFTRLTDELRAKVRLTK